VTSGSKNATPHKKRRREGIILSQKQLLCHFDIIRVYGSFRAVISNIHRRVDRMKLSADYFPGE
jgi:hypothetical protein